MPVNLTPTTKPSSTTSAATPLAIKNTPSADGCNYDSQGKPNCAVQSQGAEYDPFARLRAENGGGDCEPGKPCPQPAPTPFYKGGGPKGNDINFIRGEENTAKEINDIIDYAINGKFSKECADAFRAVGAIPIGEQKTLIVTENVIKSEINDKTWSTGNFAKQVRGGLAANPTTNDLSSKGFIGVTNRAITKEDDYFSVIIIHSFIHSGGIPGKDDKTFNEKFWSVPAHDLRYLGEKYKNILKYCTKEGKSKGLGQDPL